MLLALTFAAGSGPANAVEVPPVSDTAEATEDAEGDERLPQTEEEAEAAEKGDEGFSETGGEQQIPGERPADGPSMRSSFPATTPQNVAAPISEWREARAIRLAGEDRYSTAVAVSMSTYPLRANTVLVSTGADFPDSLSAAALAAKLRAPLLLVQPKSIPLAVAKEIERLKPQQVVIVGGSSAVNPEVETQLRSMVPSVHRLAGDDRYATSVAIAKWGWTASSGAFVASGDIFADALSAGAAAAKIGAPVILVPTGGQAPRSIREELTRLNVSHLHVAGGKGAVSAAMQNSLTLGSNRAVTRYAGEDRFETSAKIARGIFGGHTDTYWANGVGFPDALAGSAAAGARGGALLLVNDRCVPTVSYEANDRLLPADTYVLGGVGTLANEVLAGNECMIRPAGASDADWKITQSLYSSINQTRFEMNLSALRVSDAKAGMPAFSWAKSIGGGDARLNTNLTTQQPWARYQAVTQTRYAGERSDRLLSLFSGNSEVREWLYRPNNGSRGFVSVGCFTSNAQIIAVVQLGGGLG